MSFKINYILFFWNFNKNLFLKIIFFKYFNLKNLKKLFFIELKMLQLKNFTKFCVALTVTKEIDERIEAASIINSVIIIKCFVIKFFKQLYSII